MRKKGGPLPLPFVETSSSAAPNVVIVAVAQISNNAVMNFIFVFIVDFNRKRRGQKVLKVRVDFLYKQQKQQSSYVNHVYHADCSFFKITIYLPIAPVVWR